VANAIHDISAYGNGAFVPVNCGAIPEGIVESELFGHVKGAFTGAVKERKGRFELAHKGTLFLDEVAELPLKIQVKLLRFLQEGTFEKVGGEKKMSVEVRIISAANQSLKEAVRDGRFREDLYYRLNVIPIHLPPLRQRKNDIPLLISYFLKQAEQENNATMPTLAGDTLNLLLDYDWPGNVRELKNVIQFSVVRCRGDQILPADLPPEITQGSGMTFSSPREPDILPEPGPARGRLDVASVKAALTKTGGNKSKAARVLGVGRATLYRFLNNNADAREFSRRF
jgi:DNA-binding NtrC family response regulator